MSEQETIKGTIKFVADKNDVEKIAGEILKELGAERYNGETNASTLVDIFYKEYVLIQGALYKIQEIRDFDSQYFFEIKNTNPGEYEFFTSFYNGGTCLSELLQDLDLEEIE